MTKKTINYTLIVLLLSTLTITNWSCEKIFGGDSVEENIILSQDKTQVTPFEIVTITAADYTFSNDVYYATIADKDIELSKTTDNQLMFMMPNISGGKQILTFVIDNHNLEVEFNIDALPIIDNPEGMIIDFKQEISNMVDTIEYLNSVSGLNVSEQNLQLIKSYLSEFEQASAIATDAEKQELAQFMQLHPQLFDLSYFNFQILNDSLNVGSRDFVEWDNRLSEDVQYFKGLVIITGTTIVIFNGTLYSGNIFLIGAATLALATEFILVYDQAGRLFNRTVKPFLFDIFNDQKVIASIEFENNIQHMLGIDASYRTLYNNDEGSSSVIIDLVANINTFTGYWNNAVSYVPGLDGTVSNLDDQNAYKVNSTTAPITPQYVTIKNISNSNVTLSQFSNTDVVRVTFTTTSDEDQDFTFDIVYTNPDFSVETKQISATLTCGCETFMVGGYEAVQIGTQIWMVNNMDYPSGTYIPTNDPFGNEDWVALEYNEAAWCNGINGSLYTWNAALNVCPPGWHLPSYAEYEVLENYLGTTNAGGKLKATTGWNYPNYGATNETCFTAFSENWRTDAGGSVWGFGEQAVFWTSTEDEYGDKSWSFILTFGSKEVQYDAHWHNWGLTVRCIKD